MNRKNELGSVALAAAILSFLFSTVAGPILSAAYGQETISDAFTHTAFAEFGTATW